LILVTGGAGYIGSQVVKALVENGYRTVVVDDLSTGHRSALPPEVPFYRVDLLLAEDLNRVLEETRPEAVIHFAA